MKNIQIFGVNIAKTTKKEVLERIDFFLSGKEQSYFVTPNPEMLLEAGRDEEFFYVLNQSDMAIPDGIGLKFAAWTMGENLTRITGADLVLNVLKIAKEKKMKVGIINWKKGLSSSKEIARGLWRDFEGLNFYIEDIKEREDVDIKDLRAMQEYKPDILFVTFGAPYQEKFIYHNLKNIPSVKFATGIGASFDYISGKAKRAPWIMRKLGLEWLYRFFGIFYDRRAERRKRVMKAVFQFTTKFVIWRFILPYLYRPNVSCLMYKKEGDKYKIFIVKRATAQNEHWQLPQGGVDRGEKGKDAGMRELREEAGTDKFKFVKFFKSINKYIFQLDLGHYNEGQRHNGYKGQKQSLIIAEFKGKDDDIKIEFWDHDEWMWVDSEKLVDKVFHLRRKSTRMYLQKFKETLRLNK